MARSGKRDRDESDRKMDEAFRLFDHLTNIHGLEPVKKSLTALDALHDQDHRPGHGYGGHGWQHFADDIYLTPDDES